MSKRKGHNDRGIAFRVLSKARQQQLEARRKLQPLAADQVRDLALATHGALLSITQGTGTEEDASTLACASNIALILCEKGLGEEYMEDVLAGQEAIVRMMRRGQTTGRWGLDGLGIRAVQKLLEVHDAQIESPDCVGGLLTAVIAEVHRRVSGGQVMEVVSP